jgi:hypothetical protein
MRRLGLGGTVAAACLVAAGATFAISATGGGSQATKQAGSEELKAFQRSPRAGDAIPRGAPGPLTRRFGRVVASRRIATADGFRGRAALYLLRLRRHYTCLIQVERRGAGGGCSPSGQFSAKRRVAAGGGNGFFHGVAGNEIAKVAFVDRHWRLRPVRLARGGGFLYVCRNRNGCIDVIKAVNGYNRRGRLVSHERW